MRIEKINAYGDIDDFSLIEKINEIIDVLNNRPLQAVSYYSMPCLNKPYYYISSKGNIEKKDWLDSDNDRKRQRIGNCFTLREEAEKAKAKFLEVFKK